MRLLRAPEVSELDPGGSESESAGGAWWIDGLNRQGGGSRRMRASPSEKRSRVQREADDESVTQSPQGMFMVLSGLPATPVCEAGNPNLRLEVEVATSL